MVKSLQEGLGGIRDVLIDGTQEFYCKVYRNEDLPLRRASGNNVFIGGSPKFAMEAIGMTLIAGLAYLMTKQEGGMVSAIPVLGALALGAQRLLPALQQAYHSYSTIKGSKSSFEDVLNLFKDKNACIQLLNSNDLVNSYRELLNNNELRINMIDNAIGVVAENKGSSEKQFNNIKKLINYETSNSNNKTI